MNSSLTKEIKIRNRIIGPGHPCFIVAELSGNHNGSLERAKKIIAAAVEAGVDAIKLQTYTADTLTIDSTKEWFQVKVNEAWAGQTLYSLYKKAYTPWEWHAELKEYAEERGAILFSTPFDATAVDFLEALHVELYKVASFEAADTKLLETIASTGKPVIISRGLQSADDIQATIDILRSNGSSAIAVLHCISSYPAALEQMNVATVRDISERFNVISGLSDHSLGITASIAAVAQGASIIEKHVTLSRAEGGPDALFSLEPKEIRELVNAIRDVEKAIGSPTYDMSAQERPNLVFKRSLFVVSDIKKGDVLTRDNIRVIRPGYGLPPKKYDSVLGKRAVCDIKRGTPLTSELFS